MNKPLTKLEQAKVAEWRREHVGLNEYWTEKVTEDGAFWREAVKNAKHTIGDANDICIYTMQHVRMCGHLKCPWLLAQE